MDNQVLLKVDGKIVPLNDFIQKALSGVVEGFVSALHDVSEHPQRIELTISKK